LLVATSSDGKEKDLLQPSAKSSVGEKVTFGISTKEADASCMYCTVLYYTIYDYSDKLVHAV